MGCNAADYRQGTYFEPLAGNEFRYVSESSFLYPEGGKLAEGFRMAKLGEWLAGNAMCLDGHEITERKPVALPGSTSYKDIYYRGRCVTRHGEKPR